MAEIYSKFLQFTSRSLLPIDIKAESQKRRLPEPPVELVFIEKEIFYTLNLLRADPHFFVNNVMEPVRNRYRKRDIYYSYSNGNVATEEGILAVDSCI